MGPIPHRAAPYEEFFSWGSCHHCRMEVGACGAISNDFERTLTLTLFSMSPLFDAKYLSNGYRYGHSYYRRRIENCTQAFEWHHFQ